jgi:hypothetical protein
MDAPELCPFCGSRQPVRSIADVERVAALLSPSGALDERVKTCLMLMLAVCGKCMWRYGPEGISQRIEKELERRTRVH